ncbi:MAG: outer membrane beta-barrel protein [Planctomycetota bacterium]|jgi:opacity protein-like surface antigen|nr:outer membrane beta-barrel protein [Planctomycetota bacterium]
MTAIRRQFTWLAAAGLLACGSANWATSTERELAADAESILAPVPLAEAEEEADKAEQLLPEYDWRDDAYDLLPSSVTACYDGCGHPLECHCRQGTAGCTCMCPRCGGGPRWYVSGIVGASFGTLILDQTATATTPAARSSIVDPLFTAGGTLGVAFARPAGWLRVEVEGRARDPIGNATQQETGGLVFESESQSATDGWSAMVNLWRDLEITDSWSIYGGAGIGGGGYQFAYDYSFLPTQYTTAGSSAVSAFAWQIGGGVIWNVSDRIALDLGYRFFEIGPGTTTLVSNQGGFPAGTTTLDTSFSTSELLLSVRIYEPFRGWR